MSDRAAEALYDLRNESRLAELLWHHTERIIIIYNLNLRNDTSFHSIHNVVDRGVLQAMWVGLPGRHVEKPDTLDLFPSCV